MGLHTSFDNRREKAITEEHEIIFFFVKDGESIINLHLV